MSRVRAARASALIAAVLAFSAAAAVATEAEVLARFRKAFDPATLAPASERAAAAVAVGTVEGRSGPEAVCRALAGTLDRAESLALERSRGREEMGRIQDLDQAAGNTTTPERKARLEFLRGQEETLRERGEDEGRVEAALRGALGHFIDPRALEWLAGSGIRGSPQAAIRAACADALGGSGSSDPAVIRSVRGALKDKEALVREAALKAVALLRGKEEETLGDLAISLEDPRWTVRLAAARRLAGMGVPRSVDLIVARLPKEEGQVAEAFGELLGSLTGQRFGTEADGWKRWW